MPTTTQLMSPAALADGRNWLKEVSTTVKTKPLAMVAYGPPGVGKTSFGAAVPNRVFLIDAHEDGIGTLKQSKIVDPEVPVLPPATNWLEVLGMVKAVRDSEHNYKALVIDSLGGIERLCHEHVCQEDFGGEWGDRGFMSYHKGYEASLRHWLELLNLLDDLRADREMRVIALAHSIIRPFKNPTGEDYDRFIADTHPKTWAVTHKWADMVLFCNYFVAVDTKKGSRAKGRGGQERVMYTEYHAAYDAKNRHALPSDIPMGSSGVEAWGNLVKAITAARGK